MLKAGQKVCCIRDDEFEKLNRRGDIYTINSIASYGGERWMRLGEVTHGWEGSHIPASAPSYLARPLLSSLMRYGGRLAAPMR